MTSPLLDVRGLSIGFPAAMPVRDLSFSIERGETVALVGESGSGKSMTALALMGLLPRRGRVAAGVIGFAGRDLVSMDERQRRSMRGREMAMVFQEPMTSLNPVHTIGRQIMEVVQHHEGLPKAAARARAVELLDLVRVADAGRRVDDYPHQLSGGMRQRVMIAIAVACRPKLLIADEPTTALDVTIQAQVLDLLDGLRRDLAMSLLLITHDLGVVRQWADRVVVMYAGRKVESGDAEAVFDRPSHPYTIGLLAASPRGASHRSYRDGALVEIPGSISSALGEAGCPFAPRCVHVHEACRSAPPPAPREISPGPISPGPISPGPISSGPISSGPISSGPISSGPISSGPISSGPISSGPISSGHAAACHLLAATAEEAPRVRVTGH